jgi:hypothetical protein
MKINIKGEWKMSIIQNYFNDLTSKYYYAKYHKTELYVKNEMVSFIIGLELSGNNIEANLCKEKFDKLENQSN